MSGLVSGLSPKHVKLIQQNEMSKHLVCKTFDEAVEQAMKREFWECDDVNICNFTAWNCGDPIETDLKTEWEFVVNPQPGWSF